MLFKRDRSHPLWIFVCRHTLWSMIVLNKDWAGVSQPLSDFLFLTVFMPKIVTFHVFASFSLSNTRDQKPSLDACPTTLIHALLKDCCDVDVQQ